MRVEKVVKSTQEQAIAVWVGLLNQLRLSSFFDALNKQESNFVEALKIHGDALSGIYECILKNRGGDKGIHGFIAEIAECGIENAQRQLHGLEPNVELLDNNGPVDLCRGIIDIQMKFSNSRGEYSLGAVSQHLNTYPWFLDDNSVYQIAKDHYETVLNLYNMSQEEAGKLVASGEGPSYCDWKYVQDFFKTNDIKIEDIEPSNFKYAEVQRDAIGETMAKEKEKLVSENENIKKDIYNDHKPSVQEGAKATAVGAILEGATSFTLSVKRHLGSEKRLRDLTQDDWIEIAKDSGMGLMKGGVRGGAVYWLNNYTATPASVASALVTASFGVADCANRFRKGELTEVEFIEHAEIACLDASVSALSSLMGQVLIPVPVLGSLIGNAVGTTIYELGKDFCNKHEAEILEQYTQELRDLNAELDKDYFACLEQLRMNMAVYINLLDKAFSPDIAIAFQGSIELAQSFNVPEEEILHNKREIDAFFLN